MEFSVMTLIAAELEIAEKQARAAIDLLDEGATVPFIARYRKEKTGGLDDSILRVLASRLIYWRELDNRRQSIVQSIEGQGLLTASLKQALYQVNNKSELEDLYLPYKPKRQGKAQVARKAGLEPLALALWQQPHAILTDLASQYLSADIPDVESALDGARHILIELWSQRSQLISYLREWLWQHTWLVADVRRDKQEQASKYRDYFDFTQKLNTLPSHRLLALLRAQEEGFFSIDLAYRQGKEGKQDKAVLSALPLLLKDIKIEDQQRPKDAWLLETAQLAWKTKLLPKLKTELLRRVQDKAETEAVVVFANNVRDLLLAAPAGAKITMGLDPGIRTGVKVAIVDETGKLLITRTIYPHAPRHDWEGALQTLQVLAEQYQVSLIGVGNGTASRETSRLVQALIKQKPALQFMLVSEAGASVYSASELAAQEFPTLDVSLRGAVSIARRLQDPLAELVKIDPKAIGVGQYQHDIPHAMLAKALDDVVEDCVNAVGVNVNSASVPLLTRVSGLTAGLAQAIVSYRDQHGSFASREALKKIPRFGDKRFELAAGFLRITNGSNPLDASAVHPEAYPVVTKILQQLKCNISELIGNRVLLGGLLPKQFVTSMFGLPTVQDIFQELEKPGRDPRPTFISASFTEGVETLSDLQPGMALEGVVTNVTSFGAFVDIGVHQDGLVHISHLADRFVKSPADIVKAGDIVQVQVLEIDIARKRIALCMRRATEKNS
jgi:uncharacterized protein